MIQGAVYNSIDVGYPYRLRGTNQQTQTGLLYVPPSYRQVGKALAGTAPASTTAYLPGMALGYFALHNRSAGTVVAGIGVRVPNYLWKAGQWTDSTTTFTDDTTDAQSTTATDFPMETTTNNDGYCILSRVPFNAVSFNVATASNGGTAARAPRFSNAAGTAFATAINNAFVQDAASGNYATGEQIIVFAPPVDWGKSVSLATGLLDGYYAMNVRATTAPTVTAGVATSMEIFRLYFLQENVADNTTLLEEFSGRELRIAQDSVEGYYGDGLVALFSGTANDQNRVTAQVRPV